MTFEERLHGSLDLELGKRTLVAFSALALTLIPVNGLRIHLRAVKPSPDGVTVKQTPPPEAVTGSAHDKVLEDSAFFGGAPNASTPALRASLSEAVKDYRLKGVVITDDPEAIVQDARTQKTVFLKIGSQLGNLSVKEINQGWIVLSYLGEDVKLEIP